MTGDADRSEGFDTLAAIQARVAAAPMVTDIRNLQGRAIAQINTLADKAVANAQEVDALMRQLRELLERDDEQS